jgi:hypothetical protein
MADGTTLTFARTRLFFEDPATPNVYVKACGMNSRGLEMTSELNKILVPDCDDDDKPAVAVFDITETGWAVNGEGALTEEGWPILKKFKKASVPWNVKIELAWPGALGTEIHTGKAFMQNLKLDASRGTRGVVSFSIQGSGTLAEA